MRKRKPRKCRICKKRPAWIGGDVKNPGRVCKKCYHKHAWPERMVGRGRKSGPAEVEPETYGPPSDPAPFEPPPYPWCYDPFYYYVHVWRRDEYD